MDTFVRWAGGCWIGAGILVLAELAHPDALSIGFAASSRQTLWPAVHLAWVLVSVLVLFGLAGLFARSGSALGRLGAAGAVVAVVGGVVAAGAFLTEAFAFPVLAENDPALLHPDGPLLGPLAFRLTAGLAGAWFIGLILVSVAVERARVLPRGTGILVAVAAVLFAALEGPFVPVAGKLAVVLLAAAFVWFGRGLIVADRSHTRTAHRTVSV